jgi:hypothetical protein
MRIRSNPPLPPPRVLERHEGISRTAPRWIKSEVAKNFEGATKLSFSLREKAGMRGKEPENFQRLPPHPTHHVSLAFSRFLLQTPARHD